MSVLIELAFLKELLVKLKAGSQFYSSLFDPYINVNERAIKTGHF